MQEFLLPIAFVAVLAIGFGLVLGNRYRSCSDCDDDCDKTKCRK